MMGWDDGVGAGWWVFMILAMAVFWGLVALAVVALFRGSKDAPSRSGAAHRDPMDILDERFARGEIDAEEYHARQAVLRNAIR